MPCSDTIAYARIMQEKSDRAIKEELDKLTRLLCEATSFMSRTDGGTELAGNRVSDELKQWYKEHRKLDKEGK